MDTKSLIESLRWYAEVEPDTSRQCMFVAAADRLGEILKAWAHYQETMTLSGGEDWVLQEAISGVKDE